MARQFVNSERRKPLNLHGSFLSGSLAATVDSEVVVQRLNMKNKPNC